MISKTHIKMIERDTERERECCKGIRWECCEVNCLTTYDRPAPSRSSHSADSCLYVEAISPFPGPDLRGSERGSERGSSFMKVRRLKLI